MMILPTESPTSRSSDRMASRAMNDLLEQIKRGSLKLNRKSYATK
jgi:hypothetical protein